MTTRRCHGCRTFYEIRLLACPQCGTERYAVSAHLTTARLNNHLYAAAEGNHRQGYMSARDVAAEHVERLLS